MKKKLIFKGRLLIETFVKLRPCFSHQNNSDRSAAKVVKVAIIKLISKLYIPSTTNTWKKMLSLVILLIKKAWFLAYYILIFCGCQKIMSVLRVLGINNFDWSINLLARFDAKAGMILFYNYTLMDECLRWRIMRRHRS